MTHLNRSRTAADAIAPISRLELAKLRLSTERPHGTAKHCTSEQQFFKVAVDRSDGNTPQDHRSFISWNTTHRWSLSMLQMVFVT